MAGRSALVTGASGFIGRSLASRLLADGWSVTCVGRRDPKIAGANFVTVERLSRDELWRVLPDRGFDAVFHLAAYGVAPDDRDPAELFNINVVGTASLVELAAKVRADVLVYAGSCAEYSAANFGTLIDENHPLATNELYGSSKAAGGLWGQALAKNFGLKFIWLRFFGVFGPGGAPHRLLPSIVNRLDEGQPVNLTLGEQVRDFMHVDDAVEALTQAERVGRNGATGPFNVCSGQPVTVREFALALAAAMGRSSDLLHFGALALRPGENMWLVGQPRAFHDASGFASRIPLRGEIARAVRSLNLMRASP
jgi:nucleoside-diphosphate-sugar epimerase